MPSMHGLSLVLTWIAFGMGVLTLALGVTSLTRRRVVLPWLRQRIQWQQFGWSQLLMGAYLVLETAPRLANVASAVLITISAIAFVPLVAAVVVMMRARQPGP
jgi:drug/metabolite transporter (DMT)-like permease